jgi:hypothetical protein
LNQFAQAWFDNRADALIEWTDFLGIWINRNNVVTVICQASCRNRSDVANPEYTNLH